ncbi:tRNA (guanine(26)-N(2))-dimethyltransferase, mitochondrial [Candida viswanathii]|uniref:tRNA (guanine(26)-N(2))-dimethyltransferase n=1 Tax=Candida viswanathii TaxID=5486 RepID=A0A367YNK8_9ASCO|nr:tRNA (guanine(26)-N(2))-dimethyltransferase, mitochondrial [Candida viswanathii]
MSTSHAVSESSNLAATATAATTKQLPYNHRQSYTTSSRQQDLTTTTVSSEFNTVTEGKATILTPKADEVFYNPIQQFNRDLSIMAIQAYDQLRHEAHEATSNRNKKKKKLNGLKILESLSASGLRSCRYGLEIPKRAGSSRTTCYPKQ